MFRLLLFRLTRRRAVSTIIGGLIILTLILTALGTMVAVSQQYDQYQQTINKMAEYRNQEQSEGLVANSPGLTTLTSMIISGWGSGCTTTYNCYNMSLSNVGGVGVQITRIYINSTGPAGSGCSYLASASSPHPQPCVLNPTQAIAPYAFNQANRFLNPGEVNHAVLLALPFALPDPNPAVPQNSILIATSRGNVFSFQWPLPLVTYGQSNSAFSSGIIKVAYQQIKSGTGYDSKNEQGPVNASSGGTVTAGYCHKEPAQNYPAASDYAEELNTGTAGVAAGVGDAGILWFVNPWVTYVSGYGGVLGSTITDGNITDAKTQMYVYVNIINTGNSAYIPTAGSLDLGWYSANHLEGILLGVYLKVNGVGTFYSAANAPKISPGTSYYAIYKMNIMKLDNPPSSSATHGEMPSGSVMFWGDTSITNGSGSNPGNAEDQTYFSATVLLSGFWVRYEASSSSC